jgi:hypothetical protein
MVLLTAHFCLVGKHIGSAHTNSARAEGDKRLVI